VHVFIGGEPPLERVPYLTLVLSRFGRDRTPEGVLGVVGPTRIAYERAVPTVGFVAGLMTRLLAGDPEPEAA
jgi:heat-inducible transcriptional repressor